MILKGPFPDESDALNIFISRTKDFEEFLRLFQVVAKIKFSSDFKNKEQSFEGLCSYFKYFCDVSGSGSRIKTYKNEIVFSSEKDIMDGVKASYPEISAIKSTVLDSIVSSANIIDKKFDIIEIEKEIYSGDSKDVVVLRFKDLNRLYSQ